MKYKFWCKNIAPARNMGLKPMEGFIKKHIVVSKKKFCPFWMRFIDYRVLNIFGIERV